MVVLGVLELFAFALLITSCICIGLQVVEEKTGLEPEDLIYLLWGKLIREIYSIDGVHTISNILVLLQIQ